MTSWLDFRIEPIVENIPEVYIKLEMFPDIGEGPERTLFCDNFNCGWWDVAFSPKGAIELKRLHKKWHEEGCPE